MHILAIGGLGAVGNNVSRYMVERGHKVDVMDNMVRYGVHHNLDDFKKLGINFYHGDVRCVEDFNRLPGSYDVVIEMAAQPSACDGYANPLYDYTNNTAGLLNTLEYIRKGNANSLIFFSTNKVYSANAVNLVLGDEKDTRFEFSDFHNYEGFDSKYGFNENLTLSGNEKSIYGASKAAADIFVREYSQAFGMKAIVNRCSCLYGLQQWGKPEQAWLVWWMIAAHLGLPVEYIGWKGKQVRDVLFIGDLCRLLEKQMTVLKDSPFRNYDNVFNVGGGMQHTLSLIEATNIVEKISKKKMNISHVDVERKADHCVYVSDIRHVSKEFDWIPMVNPVEGYKKINQWVKYNKKILESMYC